MEKFVAFSNEDIVKTGLAVGQTVLINLIFDATIVLGLEQLVKSFVHIHFYRVKISVNSIRPKREVLLQESSLTTDNNPR